jgi:hypothetical protein
MALLRPLAEATPGRHMRTITVATMNSGISLRHAGSLVEAITTLQEAVALFRRLHGANPAAHVRAFVMGLQELGEALLADGRLTEATAPLVESVGLLHAAGLPPLAAHFELAYVLDTLARVHEARGGHNLGLATQAEVVAHWAALARLRPEAFAARYAEAQIALAGAFAARGHPPGAALVAERDAVERWGLDMS